MDNFVETVALSRVPIGKCMVVRAAGKDIALFNVDGNVYATSDACAHAGASLGSSKLQGTTVICRAHGFRYDVTNGNCLNIQGLRIRAYPVKVIDGKIFLAIAKEAPA
jgi:3-phenylpropionate/trans-cinnamate dioxygenase ferredoxin subunit